MSFRHSGGCHCGAVRVTLETGKPLRPRACQCRFCRRHAARMVSDPEGSAELTLGPETCRYRFGTGATDFLFCGRCGVYVGAATLLGDTHFATLNLNVFDDPRLELNAEPVSYEGETAETKAERRRRRWTPATLRS